ncbi:MAG: YihY family inner membrane protein [Kiloniellales bacterium]
MTGDGSAHRLRRAAARLRRVLGVQAGLGILVYAGRRFLADDCQGRAAELSYVSLLAIVPLFAVGLAILAGFPVFAAFRADLQHLVLSSLLPDVGLEISGQVASFVDKASKLTGPGLIGLVLTAVLLLSSISGALDAIWRTAEPRPLAARFAVYWALLTLGPLLIGASLSVSGYAFAVVEWAGLTEDQAIGAWQSLSRPVSLLLAVLGFALIYFLVPNRAIHPGHALAGGLVAGVLFESLKAAFGLYLRHFPSYQLVYGAVSTVPIFLVWMYLSWGVTLFGAEIAAATPEWRVVRARRGGDAGPGARLALGLSLLGRLQGARRKGERMQERKLGHGLPCAPAEIDLTLRQLRRAGVVARRLGGGWLLARDLDAITLHDLAEILDLTPDPGAGWDQAAAATLGDLTEAARPQWMRPVGAVLGPTRAGEGSR